MSWEHCTGKQWWEGEGRMEKDSPIYLPPLRLSGLLQPNLTSLKLILFLFAILPLSVTQDTARSRGEKNDNLTTLQNSKDHHFSFGGGLYSVRS